jgi:hypothetical protein
MNFPEQGTIIARAIDQGVGLFKAFDFVDASGNAVWQAAVARTGGRFYAGTDEATIIRAMNEIDRAATGRIEIRQYSTQIPRFPPFAFAAVALWTLALALRLLTPWFTTFP